MLAYVFWHRPSDGSDSGRYEAALGAFHAALRENPPPGFRESAAFAIGTEAWLPRSGRAYEDWYLVDDWHALGTLNEAAVSAPVEPQHAAIAGAAGPGAGGVYQVLGNSAVLQGLSATTWFDKPRGTSYDELRCALEPLATAKPWLVLQRQLVLGPGPEFCVLGATAPDLPAWLDAAASARTPVWPDSRRTSVPREGLPPAF